MPGLPVVLQIEGRRCLVVGGGAVAARKVEALRRAGAEVTVVAPAVLPRLARRDGVRVVRRRFRLGDLRGAATCIAATDDPALQRRISAACRRLGIPVNVVDAPALCTFTLPAVVRRGDLVVAVSTGGRAPGFSRRVRETLEEAIPPAFGGFLRLLARARGRIPWGISYRRRQILFRRISSDAIFSLYRRRGARAAWGAILRIVP